MREKTEGTSERKDRGKDNQVTGTYRSFCVRGTKTIRITVFTKDAQHKATAPAIYTHPSPPLITANITNPVVDSHRPIPRNLAVIELKNPKTCCTQLRSLARCKYTDLKTSKNRLVFAASPVGVLDLRLTEKGR